MSATTASPRAHAILITGCSSGIGLCLAHGLRQRGYKVFATARKPADVARLADKGFDALQLDLASSDSIQLAVERLLTKTGGKLSTLINNGAYGQPGAVEDLSRETLRRQFETNVFGTMELTNRLMPVFRAQGSGRIIQISSVLGFVSLAYRGAYNATKHALEALSDTLRLELRGSGIHVVLVEPGPIKSRFRQNAYTAFKANIDSAQSAHRITYAALEKRLAGEGGEPPFTLPPQAVLKKVVRALEARRPKVRYYVTVPTHMFAVLKRLLPSRWIDGILLSASGTPRRTPPA
ncbi:MAG: SDR family NAD(P)-dependent oxidoreductase [Acidiferrobacterales bacterium]